MNKYDIIKSYLDETIVDLLPRYIYMREIEGMQEKDEGCIKVHNKLKDSKWYQQLVADMQEDGSYGRFHSMDSKDTTKKVFRTTEEAIRRMKDMGLPYYDSLVGRVCVILRKYITGESGWSDRIEKHYGFKKALNSMVGANLALLRDTSELTLEFKKLCAGYLEISYEDGPKFNRDTWDKKNHDNCDFMLAPIMLHILWLLHDNPYLSEQTGKKFVHYLWNREEGIYYLYGKAAAKSITIEDKYFVAWLYALENFSEVASYINSNQKELIREHLMNQALKLINKEAAVPKCGPVFGHYHETWRQRELCCCDMVIRIARVIQKFM